MTKEEAIKVLNGYMGEKIDPESTELYQAIELAVDILETKPSLPSDLDEVVIPELEMTEWMKYGPHTNYPWCTVPDAIKITAEHFFALGKQAGVEWGSNHLRDSTKMIPNGLEEAAENIYKTPFGTRAEDFKAGAEWMAERLKR